MKTIPILLIQFLLFISIAAAQTYQLGNHDIDVENIKNIKGQVKDRFKQKPFKITGGVSLNSIYSYRNDISATGYQPFTYMANGNIQLSIYGFSLPVSFTYANKQFNYTRPNPNFKFNRLSLRPRYKKWAAQIGDATVTFSPYTLNGVQFTGAAIEHTPAKFRIQALYGRFLKAVPENSSTGVVPSYKRMGWGIKTVYQDKGKKLGATLFHAQDDKYSIQAPVLPANKDIRPMEGTAISLEGAWPVIKKSLILDVEYATSLLTQDLLYKEKESSTKEKLFNKLVHSKNPTTHTYHAMKTALNYSLNNTGVGIAYERVDPDYRTLGAYYFTNDFANITVNVNQSLFKQSMTLSLQTGFQEDDLKNRKESSTKRLVFNGNLNLRAGKKLNIGTNYSNFRTYTYIKPLFEQLNPTTPFDNLDTLDFTQLSQNAGLNIAYQLAQQKKQAQNISINVNYMEAANERGGVVYQGEVTRFINTNINHSLQLTPQELTIATALLYSWNYTARQISTTWGPSLNITKSLFKKLMRTNLGGTYSVAENSVDKTGVVNIRAGAAAVINKKHTINSTLLWQKRMAKIANKLFTGTVTYAFNF